MDTTTTAPAPAAAPPASPLAGFDLRTAWWEGWTLAFLGVILLANAAAFALYLLLPPFAPLIFLGLNGALLGREYVLLAARRRMGREDARRFARTHGGTVWLAGALMALPLTVPVLNLLVPVLGAATFTHLVHRLGR